MIVLIVNKKNRITIQAVCSVVINLFGMTIIMAKFRLCGSPKLVTVLDVYNNR